MIDPLPSWNDVPAKSAIEKFVQAATDPTSPDFVPEGERLATFDQDGTLWVEHPIVTQVAFAFARVGRAETRDRAEAQQHVFAGMPRMARSGGRGKTFVSGRSEPDEETVRRDDGEKGGDEVGPESHGGEPVTIVGQAKGQRLELPS